MARHRLRGIVMGMCAGFVVNIILNSPQYVLYHRYTSLGTYFIKPAIVTLSAILMYIVAAGELYDETGIEARTIQTSTIDIEP